MHKIYVRRGGHFFICTYVRGLNFEINEKFKLIGISTLKNRNCRIKLLPEVARSSEIIANSATKEIFSVCQKLDFRCPLYTPLLLRLPVTD